MEFSATFEFDPDVLALLTSVKFGAAGGVTEVAKEKFCLMYTLSHVGELLPPYPPLL